MAIVDFFLQVWSVSDAGPRPLAGVSAVINARYAANFGNTPDDRQMFATFGIAVEVLAFVLPTVSAVLRRTDHGRSVHGSSGSSLSHGR